MGATLLQHRCIYINIYIYIYISQGESEGEEEEEEGEQRTKRERRSLCNIYLNSTSMLLLVTASRFVSYFSGLAAGALAP